MKSLPLQALWIVVTDSQADLDKGYGHFMWFFSSLGCLSLSGCPGCSAMVVSNAPFQPDPLQELLVVTVYCVRSSVHSLNAMCCCCWPSDDSVVHTINKITVIEQLGENNMCPENGVFPVCRALHSILDAVLKDFLGHQRKFINSHRFYICYFNWNHMGKECERWK